MTKDTMVTDDELHDLCVPEFWGLEKFGDEWLASWSDGDRVVSHHIHTKSKTAAEYELKRLLVDYLIEKRSCLKVSEVVRAIHSASKIELAEIACHVKNEMKVRGMRGSAIGWNLPRRGVCRAKDIIARYYERRDLEDDADA